MARSIRTRSRTVVTSGVRQLRSETGALMSETVVNKTDVSNMTDYVGRPVVPSPLAGASIKGVTLGSWQLRLYNGRVAYGIAVPATLSGGPTLTYPPAPSGWELSTVARSNPSRPSVFIPEMLESVIQLPRMLKSLLRILQHPSTVSSPKGFASEYLGVQFGWLPFIDDLRKIMNTQAMVLKKAKEVDQLYSGKGLRRRVRFSKDVTTSAVTSSFAEILATVHLKGSVTVTSEVWATIRWKPTGSLPFASSSDTAYHSHLRRVVLGATPEGMAIGAWKVIPWTWLIGWFTNVGDYLAVNSNSIPAAYSEACLMRRCKAEFSPGGVEMTGTGQLISSSHTGSRTYTLLSRTVGSGVLVPGFNMPFLDMFRLSVLGSLAIQRIAK